MNDKVKFFLIGFFVLPVFAGVNVWLDVMSERSGDELTASNWYWVVLPILPTLILFILLARKSKDVLDKMQSSNPQLVLSGVDKKGLKSSWFGYGFLTFGIIGTIVLVVTLYYLKMVPIINQ